MNYTKRRLEKITIKEVTETSLTTTEHSGFGVPEHVHTMVKAGDEVWVEYRNFNEIGGLMSADGTYLFRRSDEYFKERLENYLAEVKARQAKWYEENKADLETRTEALEPRYKARIRRFLNDPERGQEFREEGMGWGYELIVCELAQMYTVSEGADTQDINDYAKKHGTSGNQHDVAKAWAKHSDRDI